jgi:hypothetical protein
MYSQEQETFSAVMLALVKQKAFWISSQILIEARIKGTTEKPNFFRN